MSKDSPIPQDGLHIDVGQFSTSGHTSINQDFHGAMIPDGSALALKGVTLAVADGISSSEVVARRRKLP